MLGAYLRAILAANTISPTDVLPCRFNAAIVVTQPPQSLN